jgi:hypothetical protein
LNLWSCLLNNSRPAFSSRRTPQKPPYLITVGIISPSPQKNYCQITELPLKEQAKTPARAKPERGFYISRPQPLSLKPFYHNPLLVLRHLVELQVLVDRILLRLDLLLVDRQVLLRRRDLAGVLITAPSSAEPRKTLAPLPMRSSKLRVEVENR